MNIQQWSANFKLAVACAIALCLWVASGLVANQKAKPNASLSEQEDNVFTVQVQEMSARPYQKPILIRARTEANRKVQVVAEIDGKVILTPAREGSLVEKGAALCQLDPEDRPLLLEQANSALKKAELDYQGALKLKDGGYQSAAQIANAEAQLATAKSQVKASELAVERLTIHAPFDGLVEVRFVDAGAFVQRGSPCAQMLELNPLVVSGHVSEKDVVVIQVGGAASVQLGSGDILEGRVRYVSYAADPMTRTFRVEVEVQNAQHRWADGMSAEVTVFGKEQLAHQISPSLLALKDSGRLGIKIVEDESKEVQFVTVQLIGDDGNGAWVSGLPDKVKVITVGQEYVAHGQHVNFTHALTMRNEMEQ